MTLPINAGANQKPAFSPLYTTEAEQNGESERLENKKTVIEAALKVEGISADALAYFQRVKISLDKGVNVPLPHYFHATRYWKDILQSSAIEMRPEKSGSLKELYGTSGAFLSKIHESLYGEVAFAIDEECLKETTGHFFYTKEIIYPINRAHSLWVRVLDNIPVVEATVAFIVAGGEEFEKVKALLKKYPSIVISRDLGDEITRIFEKIIQQPEKTSPHWQPMAKYGEMPLDDSSKRYHHWWKALPEKDEKENS